MQCLLYRKISVCELITCVLGSASVDLASILKNGRDIINDDVIVTDLRDPDVVVGKMNITVEALAVLKMMKERLKARLAESD